jgi:hypothetical protein
MGISLFSDIIDALGKVAGGLKAIRDIPKAEREKYRQTLGDTYRLIDTTLNMVIIRLGDVLLQDNDNDFINEVQRLDNYGDWINAEREFRLCRSLRAARSETETLSASLPGQLSVNDWKALLDQMESILLTEGEVAEYIGRRFYELAESARNQAGPDAQALKATKGQIKEFRDSLVGERQKLISQEMELFEII